MKYSELKKLLRKEGCRFDHHGKRHDMWYSPKTGQTFPVGRHDSEDVKPGTLDNILKAAGLK